METIYVSTATIDDTETERSILGLFQKAKYPERIFVGLACSTDSKSFYKKLQSQIISCFFENESIMLRNSEKEGLFQNYFQIFHFGHLFLSIFENPIDFWDLICYHEFAQCNITIICYHIQ